MKMAKGGLLSLKESDKPLLMLRKDSASKSTSMKSTGSQSKILSSSSSPNIMAGNASRETNNNSNNTNRDAFSHSNSNGALTDPGDGFGMEFGTIYEGQWAEDREHGRGTKYWADGKIYHGAWVDGMQSGEGICKYANGAYYSGTWENNTV
jgi:hypothetical protein